MTPGSIQTRTVQERSFLAKAFLALALLISNGMFLDPIAWANHDSRAEDDTLTQVGKQVVEALNWNETKNLSAMMTAQGMADFCTQQIGITGQAHAFFQDPGEIPDTSKLVQICSQIGVDAHQIAESISILADPNFAENLRAHHNQSRMNCRRLAEQLSGEQLVRLTDAISLELANFKAKPNRFMLGPIEKRSNTEALVAVDLRGAQESIGDSRRSQSNSPNDAALYCRFVKRIQGWLFDGFDSEKLYEQQLRLLKSIDLSKVYIPQELRDSNWLDCRNRWSLARSRQSKHCIVFWAKGYGHLDPNSDAVPAKFRVDVDDLLAQADRFFETNVAKLKFADVQEGMSQLAKFKLQIFLVHTEEWVAAGAGSDDVIGGLWVSPSACQPVGSTVAHEIGHCFQYQVHCDLKGKHGFRYGFGGNGGNAFWEQSAQWQAFQDFPDEIFHGHDFLGYQQNFHRHFHHEEQRYSSYFLPYYWQQKHGSDILARIWREAIEPEDPIQAYMRISGIDFSQFNDELYDAACRLVTWDVDALRELGKPFVGAYTHSLVASQDGYSRVDYSRCPGTTGYNVMELSISPPAASGEPRRIEIDFRGIMNKPHYNPSPANIKPGWRYGFVALCEDGRRVYGEMHRKPSATIAFQPPLDCVRVWFVVTGAPESYRPHPWDEDLKNDEQWPYEVKLTATEIVNLSNPDGQQ